MELETIREQLNDLHAALARVETDRRAATADVTANGLSVIVTVMDSHGRAIERPGLNPACKVITCAERMRRSLNKQIAALEDELRRKEQAAKDGKSHWAQFAPKEHVHENS